MYSKSSLAKLLRLMAATRKKYQARPIEEIKMAISKGNRKIGKVMNVSLPPIITCPNCAQCKRYCYDVKACLQYPGTVTDARMRNLAILEKDMDEYFHRIDEAMNRRRENKYFRFHVAGDIPGLEYFEHMVEITRKHSDFVVWTYTKNYTIVNAWIAAHGGAKEALPANLHIMFSKWDGLPMANPYGLPVFACRMKAGNKDPMPWETMYKCPGNCDACKAAKRGCIGGEDTYCDEH